MGVIGKLAFWRKSSKKASAVEPFVAPAAESPRGEAAKVPEVVADSAEHIQIGSSEDEAAASPLRGPANLSPEVCSKAASSSLGVSSSSNHSPAAPSSPPRSRVSPAAALAVEGSPPPQPADLCTDADELEAELCDEILCPLPEPSPKVTVLGRATSPEDKELDFDKSLSDIFAGVSQAFGPMIASSLQSPKWDKRAQALKAVGTMLRGLDLQGMAPPGSTGVLGKGLNLRSRVCCWRSCCELLHHVMCDKVMPVRLASHELFMEAFANAEGLVEQDECHKALNVLIQHTIDRLGDSNLRLHESARKCVVFCAEQPFLIGLDAVLARLQTRLGSCGKGGDRQKVCNGVLDAVNFLLQHFPGRRVSSRNLNDDDSDDEEAADSAVAPGGSWTAADIAPFITVGMDDSLGPRVRTTVIALAVTVYQTFGMEAMTPLLESLRPAKQALLRQKFQESEDMDPEDFARNTHCGTTASTMATPSEGVTRSDSFCDIVVRGSAVKIAGSQPQLPGSLEDPEEDLMDAVLEETGMVFNGACIVNEAFGHDARCLRPIPGLSRTLLEDDLEEEHRILEEELLKLDLDMDLEAITEQEALIEDHRLNGIMRQELDVMEVC